jgi:hypothetical protein
MSGKRHMQRVLYVGQDATNPNDYCPGSVLCLACVQQLRATKINVQDTSVLRQRASLPAWLNGTPILIDNQGGRPMRGMEAYRYLQSLVQQESTDDTLRQRRPTPQRPMKAASAPPARIDPSMTRQPAAKQRPRIPQSDVRDFEDAVVDDQTMSDDEDALQDATAHGNATTSFSNDKVTEDDLQRFMQQRNASPASASHQSQSA